MTPHLIHIGYPKTGSTYLQWWFTDNPNVAFVPPGFGGVRDIYEISRLGVELPRPVELRVTSFEGLAAPHRSFGHEIIDHLDLGSVPMPQAQEQVCAMLADLFPNAHILLVTRGFRALIFSVYSQVVRGAGGLRLAELCEMLKRLPLSGSNPFDYDFVLATYRKAFGSENVLCLPYEMLRADPGGFTSVLEERYGMTPFSPTFGRVNESLSGTELRWYPRIARCVRSLRPRRLSDALFRRYASIAMVNRLRRPIRLLDRIWPSRPVTIDMVPEDVVQAFRGRAESLADNPFYAPFRQAYLIDGMPPPPTDGRTL